jgi:hypothetical protein
MTRVPLPPLPADPLVTVVTVTYNHERFIAEAVESVLAQAWPAERLQVVVVNDGSTDGTARALDPYRDRAEVVDQQNRGLKGALSTAMERARGDLIVVCEGDDAMKPGRIAKVVRAFRDHPRAGLVYSDLELVDPEGALLEPSFFDAERLPRLDGPPRGRLMQGNFVVGTACAIRGCLKPLVHPIPDRVQWWDYWWAWAIGGVAEVAHIREPLVRYRSHGNNQTLGLTWSRANALGAKELPFRRAVLGEVAAGDGTPEEMLFGITLFWRTAARARGDMVHALVPRHPDEADALPLLAEAFAAFDAGDYALAALKCCHSAALRPFDPALFALVRALAPLVETPRAARAAADDGRAPVEPVEPVAPVDPALVAAGRALLDELGARSFAVFADARAVIDAPELVPAYAARFSADDDATLLIHAEPAALTRLTAEVTDVLEAAGLAEGGPDMLLVSEPAERAALLEAGASAQLGRALSHGASPVYTAVDIDSLRLVAERAWARRAVAA